MFPNCIDHSGPQKKETTQQKTNKEKPRKKKIIKTKKRKVRIIVPTMNHYPRNG